MCRFAAVLRDFEGFLERRAPADKQYLSHVLSFPFRIFSMLPWSILRELSARY